MSFFGIKTEVFNNEIKDSLSKINKELKININEVSYLLNPLNFNLDITTENSEVLLKKHQLDLEKVKLNVSIKSLFKKKLLINKIKLSTKEIKLKNLIIPLREIYNSPQLFILNQIVKEGNIAIDVNINFDSQGKIKDDYQIKGFINKAKIDLLNKFTIKDLNFLFTVNKKKYELSKITSLLNEIKFSSPFIEIEPNEEYCFNNLIDLKYYLINVNPKKLLTIKQKNELIMNCKKIKHYCINSCNINNTDFNSKEEIYKLAQECSMFGDIPSVRKMVRDLMKDPNKLFVIVPNISKPVQRELDEKKRLKNIQNNKLKVEHGSYILNFS